MASQTIEGVVRGIEVAIRSPESYAKYMGLGASDGLGGVLYGLCIAARALNLRDCQQICLELVPLFDPDLHSEGASCDVLSGAAGGLLGLLALNDWCGSPRILDAAERLALWIVARQSAGGKPFVWHAQNQRPLAGFSHGAAGISYALARAYAATGQGRLLQSIQAGIDYERQIYSPRHRNWPDLRPPHLAAAGAHPVRWCHGAPGIALARIGTARHCRVPLVSAEILAAIQTTSAHSRCDVDHLCCGTAGLAEVLFVGSTVPGMQAYGDAARSMFSAMLRDADCSGGFRLFANLPRSTFCPALFVGLAGIGYQALRLSGADLPSVLLLDVKSQEVDS